MNSSVVNAYRTFIAIELPQSIRALVAHYIDQLHSAFPGVRASWLREDNLHLTLKFLGDVPVTRLPALSDAADEAARSIQAFNMIVSGCGSFPPRGQPKVLWIGIDDAEDNLSRLHQGLEESCAVAGFERDARDFHPHLTIARLRKPAGSRGLAEAHRARPFSSQRFTVSEIVVFKSELLREGSKHTALSRHQLVAK